MREKLVGIVFILECIESRQLPFSVPSQLPFITMPIIDIDFDIAGVGAASWCEETTCTAADFRSDSGEGIVWEANVEQAGVGDLLVSFMYSHFEEVEGCRDRLTYRRAMALRYG